MGNSCRHMLMEDSDESVSARSTSSSAYKKRSFFNKMFRTPSFSKRAKRAFSFRSTVYEDPISKTSQSEKYVVESTDTLKSPKVYPRAGIIPRDELNKEADDFIAKMRGQMKIERKESEMEYLQRIERGAI